MTYDKRATDLMNRYPAITDLQRKAHKRIPNVAKEYLETGTDDDKALLHNRKAFDDIKFRPHFLKGELTPDLSTTLFGKEYSVPFGIAPVGLTGLMWPQVEVYLAQMAADKNIPYCLSTVATETPERIGPLVGQNGWFQLYTPRDEKLAFKILDRAKNSGFHTLVITVDIPQTSRRQRTKRAGMTVPPRITPRFIWQGITHPAWTWATVRRGLPQLRTISDENDFKGMASVISFVTNEVGGNLSWEYVKVLKDYWNGPVILKGIMHEEDALKAADMGIDAIVVSNHGGRQFDGVPASIEALPKIKKALSNRMPIFLDSGVRTGLDVMRAIALGADFVFLGRAFIYGVAALGKDGAYHTYQIIREELENNMRQLGIETLDEIRALKVFRKE